MTPAAFRAHVDAIAESGRRAVTVGELVELLRTGEVTDRPVVAVTFDDGWADFPAAAEILHSRALPSTLYVTSGFVGQPGYVTSSQLRELAGASVEIGAHGVTHERLDELRPQHVEDEVRRSKADLEDVIQQDITTFAYPHGNHTGRTKRVVRAAGYRSAAAVKNALSHSNDDPFALARVTVRSDTDARCVARLLAGEGAPLASSRERMRTKGYRYWRLARRTARSRRGTS